MVWTSRAGASALVFGCILALFAHVGCSKPKKRILTKEQQRSIQDSILTTAPTLTSPINANLADKIRLLGVEVSPAKATPGTEVTFTYYWEVLDVLEGEWKVFGHLERPGKRQLLDHHPVRDLYPIKDWAKGQIIKDEQRFTLDKGFSNGEAVLWLGVFNEQTWNEKQANDRLEIKNPNDVPHDKDNRIRAATLMIEGSTASTAPPASGRRPKYIARQTPEKITIDGKLDEEAWKSAPKTRNFAQPDGKPGNSSYTTYAKVIYDETNLYVGFHTQDDDIRSTFENRDDTLWEQDVVEIYLDPDNDGKNYVELQVSPKNVVFDAVFASHRTPPWREAASKSLPIQSAVSVDGTVNEDGGDDKSWTVELAIPFTAIPGVAAKPEAGATWTVNLYRIDNKGPRDMGHQAVWAPVGGDFHNLTNAGELTFAPAALSPPTPPATAAPPTTPSTAPAGTVPAPEPPTGTAPATAPNPAQPPADPSQPQPGQHP